MRKFIFTLIALFLIFQFKIENANSWGFEAHKKITELAIDIILNLQSVKGVEQQKFNSLKKFLEANKATIIERCIEPDMVRNELKDEQFNHFIDIDRYGSYPFEELPRDKRKAIEKFGFENVQKNGLLPWRIAEVMDSLGEAISNQSNEKMLRYFSWIAHYVEDAHQPLHVTENYDGQLTNQPGIHSRFETELVKHMISKNGLNFNPKRLASELVNFEPISDKVKFAFDIVLESYNYIEPILEADRFAKDKIPVEKLYRVEKRDGRTRYIYSDDYYSIMNERLGSLVLSRMEKSAVRLAYIWLNVWNNYYK
jgi:hypothetical protein